jgi:hypothetical protein
MHIRRLGVLLCSLASCDGHRPPPPLPALQSCDETGEPDAHDGGVCNTQAACIDRQDTLDEELGATVP